MTRSINRQKKNKLKLQNKLYQPIVIKDHLENTAFNLLLITIFVAAIPFGTVDLWSKSLLVFLICLIGILRVSSIFFSSPSLFSNGSLIFPLAGLLGLAIIQIVPLSWGNYDGKTISLDEDSTKNFILVFSGLIIAAEVLLSYTNNQKRLKTLIYLVLVVGIGSAIFGFLRNFLFKDSQSGLWSYFYIGTGFAQFINRNHFLFLMEMTIGLLLGFLLKGNLSEKYRFFGWVATGFLFLMSISANSRGGLLSLTGIFMVGVIFHFLTRNNRNKYDDFNSENKTKIVNTIRKVVLVTLLASVVFGTIVVTIAFVGGDEVATHLENIQTEVDQNDNKKINRLAIWKATFELIKEKPLMGVGLGGYSAAITKFDKASGKMAIHQAHNDYLEILANGGIIAFLFFLLFAVILILKASKQFQTRNYLRRASCFGAILGILGVAIHSLVDFGLHALINALIFIVLAVIATAKVSSSEKSLKLAS